MPEGHRVIVACRNYAQGCFPTGAAPLQLDARLPCAMWSTTLAHPHFKGVSYPDAFIARGTGGPSPKVSQIRSRT